ncbi:MAG: hypothetical protein DI569_15460 [Sphingopyxis macrogoltabida]|uniref:Uncharacterized protein n=1 Tax=Sphingopyxis macrogoltabida TaxID=33050 RepID=A0A2W5MRV4_SPHMC|nr:MAG: hypothetical protein DI569_15460 [Sphingopyxis macrogoltabida]
MFTYDPRPTFTHKVKVKVPVDGGHADQDFKATFAVMPADEVSDYELGTIPGSTDFLKKIIVSMSDLVGKDDQPVSYNDQVRDGMLSLVYVRKALVQTYLQAMAGAQAGN